MIVSNVESGWEVVFQPSHGLLAAKLAMELKGETRPRYWMETIAAILTHDDYKQPFDGHHYVTDVGAPKDFSLVSMSDSDRLAETERRITQADRKHRWLGLLISRHAEHLYGDQPDISDDMAKLLQSEQDRRKRVLRKLKLKLSDLEQAYAMLQWCDRCSLILVTNKTPAMQRRIEITHRLHNEPSYLWRREDDLLQIEPWPFASDRVTVGVEVHQLNQLSFRDDAELERRLNDAEIEYREWTFCQ